jgi:hypothetical protein
MTAPNSKQLNIVQQGSLYKIHYPDGGKVPSTVAGLFTSKTVAEAALNAHYSAKEAKVKKKVLRSKPVKK